MILIGLTGAFLFGNSGKAGKVFKEYLKGINFLLNLTLFGISQIGKKYYCPKWRVPAISDSLETR